MFRLLGGSDNYNSEGDGSDEHFGVHISYQDLYLGTVFLTAIYAAGLFTSKLLKMPSLVGEIFAGILLGPNLANIVPYAEAFVMLGEIGLILLVVEAGIDMDLTKLKLVGARGIMIAVVGTFLPILIAGGVALLLGYRGVAAIAAGCTFAPTSLGIAMNVLRASNIVNTPVGQLIVAAAIIDDMIALVILSQLEALTGELTLANLAIPVVSALGFLVIGGYLAVFVLPGLIDRYLLSHIPKDASMRREWVSLAIMFALLLALIPATYYCRASPLMGAFLAGLVFCSSHSVHLMFESQFKRVMQWLLRIFFAASIGFQVPIHYFGSATVLLQGLAFTTALLGKVVVGFLAPNFSLTDRFAGNHLRDCLAVGFSMAAEGEFAFVLAVFAVSNNMITEDLYASIVLAVLLSTIAAPFALRMTLSRFNQAIETKLLASGGGEDPDSVTPLEAPIQPKRSKTIFYCIQTKSKVAWGIQADIMSALSNLHLDIIDHRSWHPPHSTELLVNEVYVSDLDIASSIVTNVVEEDLNVTSRIETITATLQGVIHQDAHDAIVRVQRWFPNVHKGDFSPDRLAREAGIAIERSRHHMSSLVELEDLNTTSTTKKPSRQKQQNAQDYVQMEEGGNNNDSNNNNSNNNDGEEEEEEEEGAVEHLDGQFEGHLEGFIRHDNLPRTRSLTYDDAVELLSMGQGSSGYYS